MTFRKIDTCIWRKPWFELLNRDEKLAFIYLWTNDYCNQAGIYEISTKRIQFDLGYGIDTVSVALKNRVEWYPDKSIVWVKNFFKHQCQNAKFAISAINCIKGDPFKYDIFIDHNINILKKYKNDLNGHLPDTIWG